MISRLRLQLAASFALVFLIGLGAADLALFTWLRRNAERDFAAQLSATARGVAANIAQEITATQGTLGASAREVLGEWPAESTGLVVYGTAGEAAASRGTASLRALVPAAAQLPADHRTWEVPLDAEGALALSLARSAASATAPAFSVVAFQSTAAVREATERLALWLLLSAPLVVGLAVVGAYFLARRALVPLHAMTGQITAIAPGDLDRRLPVRVPPDELDALAEQFNRLLERLSLAQRRNRRFLAQAAHQLRTPLTVIRGESGLGLDRLRTAQEYQALLRRVSLAAEQMTHRVDDLFLLAQAEAGDRPPLTDQIELDGLVLECVDLMRGRADAMGRHLELGTMDAAEVLGNEPLIREAVLELIENACRYGDPARPIRVEALATGTGARVEVTSAGALVPVEVLADATDGARPDKPSLGLSIVRWIAAVHGGGLNYRHAEGANVFTFELRATPAEPGAPGAT